MKIEQNSHDVTSTMVGEKFAMGVRVEDMPHMMGVMAGLYENRLRAIVREYSSNAADAHVEAGVALPIEVRLPSPLDPSLRIRDYGIGLSKDDIREVYSQYGRSTKRNTNAQVGMLGLGCKSALSYTSQFTVTSVKDGRSVTVLVAVEESGAGTMQVLADDPTEAANGTEVTIAIRREDVYRCKDEAEDFFSYWPAGSVLLNGRQPKSFKEDALRLSDSLYIVSGASESKVVMGNVAYPANIDIGLGRYSGVHLVAYVPIGSVKPTPSREALMDTRQTTDALAAIARDYNKQVEGAIQREADKAATPQDAIRIVNEWASYVPRGATHSYSYRGVPFPAPFSLPPWKNDGRLAEQYFAIASALDYGYRSRTQTTEHRTLDAARWPTTVWVSNFTPEKFTADHKRKLAKWREQTGLTVKVERYVLLPGDAPKSFFIDPATCVDYSIVRKIKLDPKVRGVSGRIPGSFNIHTEAGYSEGIPGSDLRLDKPIFYVRGNRWEASSYVECLQTLLPEFTVVCLAANRVEKFKRDVPQAKSAPEAAQQAYDEWEKKLTKDQRLALAMNDYGQRSNYRGLDPSKVDDPELREAVRVAKLDVSKLREQRNAFRSVVNVAARQTTNLPAPLAKYPLYSARLASHEHTYLYLNAVYAALTNNP